MGRPGTTGAGGVGDAGSQTPPRPVEGIRGVKKKSMKSAIGAVLHPDISSITAGRSRRMGKPPEPAGQRDTWMSSA